jgi:ubiquinone/menaquinone biosynthesis C-methylase UbiE
MSLRGRYIIDRIKQAMGGTKYFRLPVPPYGDAEYWNAAYQSLGSHQDDSFEWGDVSLGDVWEYEHKRLDHYYHGDSSSKNGSTTGSSTLLTTTLAETIGIAPNADRDEPMLMLGCGNSRLGEEMIDRGWRGPLIQVDVSNRVIESMSQRCGDYIQQGHMNFIQDDATELSAFRNGMMQACLDKGLIDALFCADEYDQCQKVLKSVHRVLKPGGTFVVWSFSRPEFILPQCMDSTKNVRQNRALWQEIQVHELSKIMLYKFQKKEEVDDGRNTRLVSSSSSRKVRR